ncbi:MAG: beta strand repeat-containing protein [Puniceicoccales bacterium]
MITSASLFRIGLAAFSIPTLAIFTHASDWKDFTQQGGSFDWSTGSNWISGVAPVTNNQSLLISFDPAISGTVTDGGKILPPFTSNNDLGTVQLNQLNLAGAAQAGNAGLITISGGSLDFYGADAQINMTATGGGTGYLISSDITTNTDFTIDLSTSSASSGLSLSGAIDIGANRLTLNSYGGAVYNNTTGRILIQNGTLTGTGDIYSSGSNVQLFSVASGWTGDLHVEQGYTSINSNFFSTGSNAIYLDSDSTLGISNSVLNVAGLNDGDNGGGNMGIIVGNSRSLGIRGADEYSFSGDIENALFSATGTLGLNVNMNAAGRQILSGNNSFEGNVAVNNGTLRAASSTALGATSAGTMVANGATLELAGDISVGAESLTVTGLGEIGRSGVIVNVSGNNSWAGTLALGDGGSDNNVISSDSGSLTFTNTGAITSAGTDTLTLTGAGDGQIDGSIQGASVPLVKSGTGTWTLTGTNAYTGSTTVSGGVLVVDGSIATSSGVEVQSGASLGGSGTVSAITGAGTVGPGNSPGILTADSAEFSTGLDLAFEMTATGSPTWSDATSSGNDVLRLTDGSTPIIGTIDGDNSISVYFSSTGTFIGGVFTDLNSDFESLFANADFLYYLADAGGGIAYNGTNYSELASEYVSWTTVQVASADFASGTINNGWAQEFTVTPIPEPSTWVLPSLIGFGLILMRRKK